MTFQLLHYSDPHFGACDLRIARAAVELAVELRPDLTVVSGDFSMRGRRYEFGQARSWLDELPQPLVTLPGNHDVPGLNHILDRFFSPFGRYRRFISEIEEPNIQLGGIGVLATRTPPPPSAFTLTGRGAFSVRSKSTRSPPSSPGSRKAA
jgi:Icc-related predicted phosphoesterase